MADGNTIDANENPLTKTPKAHPYCLFGITENTYDYKRKAALGVLSLLIAISLAIFFFYSRIAHKELNISFTTEDILVAGWAFFIFVSCHHARVAFAITFINYDQTLNEQVQPVVPPDHMKQCTHPVAEENRKRLEERHEDHVKRNRDANHLRAGTIISYSLFFSYIATGIILMGNFSEAHIIWVMLAQICVFWIFNFLNWYRLVYADQDRKGNISAIVTDGIFFFIVLIILSAQFQIAPGLTEHIRTLFVAGAFIMLSALLSEFFAVYWESISQAAKLAVYDICPGNTFKGCRINEAQCKTAIVKSAEKQVTQDLPAD